MIPYSTNEEYEKYEKELFEAQKKAHKFIDNLNAIWY
jgi:hypothetical protein